MSTDQQSEAGTSLDTQLDRCRQYATTRGYTIVREDQDVSSGTRYRDRPALSALRDAIRRHDVQVVIVYALDRLSRNQAHVAVLYDELSHAGARLECVTETFEDTAVGRFILAARSFAAEIEHEKIVERTNRGRRRRVELGKLLPGGTPRYGYQWNADHSAYVVDPLTAPTVRRIFDLAAAGTPILAIAATLTSDGVPAPRGGSRWAGSTVWGILRQPAYAGRAVGWAWHRRAGEDGPCFDASRGIPYPDGVVPALVDAAAWDAVQATLRRNKERSARNSQYSDVAMLRAGLARCGVCGYAMAVKRQAQTGHLLYVCNSNAWKRTGCRQHSIQVAELDAAVWSAVQNWAIEPSAWEPVAVVDPRAAELERAVAEVRRRQANLARVIAATDDVGATAPLADELRALAITRRRLEAEQAALVTDDGVARHAGRVVLAARIAGAEGLSIRERGALLAEGNVVALVWPRGGERRWALGEL